MACTVYYWISYYYFKRIPIASQLVAVDYGGGGNDGVITRCSVRKKKLVARTWRRLVLHVPI